MSSSTLHALELFAGIGGFAHAVEAMNVEVVGALDISSHVLEVYGHNFDHPTLQKNIEVLTPKNIASFGAQMWWMSPPCQPYTVRGLQRDLQDHRAKSLLNVMALLPEHAPELLAMENVAGFAQSQARVRLMETLDGLGFEVKEVVVCPTELGLPMRRERYYMVASRRGLCTPEAPTHEARTLSTYIDPTAHDREELFVSPEIVAKHGRGMVMVDIQDVEDVQTHVNCFTSAYGKTYRFAGSYLRFEDGRVRRFSPEEILRMMGYDASYMVPSHMTLRQQFKYIGNSVSVDAVRHVLRWLPLSQA